MLIDEVWRALIDAGVEMVPLDAQHVEFRYGRQRVRLLLKVYSRAVTPSDVSETIERHGEPGVLVVPRATAEVRRTAERAGWSWVMAGPEGVHGNLRFGQVDVLIGGQEAAKVGLGKGRSGKVPWKSFTVIRRLIEQPAATQKALADAARVSQPRVSQILAPLTARHLVERTVTGWTVRDFDGLLSLWLTTYPGPGGVSTYWFGLETPREQAIAAMRLLKNDMRDAASTPNAVGGDQFPVLSGDLAADLIAPWRSPGRAVIYSNVGADLAEAGLTPTAADEATLELIVPQDTGVFPPRRALMAEQETHDPFMPTADPLQILWDIQRSPGSDRDEAVARLSGALGEQYRAAGLGEIR
jgi:hypothetical protein